VCSDKGDLELQEARSADITPQFPTSVTSEVLPPKSARHLILAVTSEVLPPKSARHLILAQFWRRWRNSGAAAILAPLALAPPLAPLAGRPSASVWLGV